MTYERGIIGGFDGAANAHPDRPALEVSEAKYSYRELRALAQSFAFPIREVSINATVGILASRSAVAYGGILGTLYAGSTYIPLNPEFPVMRSAQMLEAAGCTTVIADEQHLGYLAEIASVSSSPLTGIVSASANIDETTTEQLRSASVVLKEAAVGVQAPPMLEHGVADLEQPAYLMFTSGSTGLPKGVPVSHKNVIAYTQYIVSMFDLSETDRASQTFDLTFDLSVHDMFTTWGAGACLCVLPQRARLAPGPFIRKAGLTHWFSVPSVAMFMDQLRQLKPGAFPDLRVSQFCGEPLTADLAEKWQAAAPESSVENLYGPTEATIAITRCSWNASLLPRCHNGIVPIGWPFEGQKAEVMDEELTPVPAGEAGELCLAGSQITAGYLNDPERTGRQFVTSGGNTWYRTGDRVVKDPDDGCLIYLGRIDEQVQVRGFRVELQEVDAALRAAGSTQVAAAVPVGLQGGHADALVGYVAGSDVPPQTILERCRDSLPYYMVPTRIEVRDELPTNSNGKISRKALIEHEATGGLQT